MSWVHLHCKNKMHCFQPTSKNRTDVKKYRIHFLTKKYSSVCNTTIVTVNSVLINCKMALETPCFCNRLLSPESRYL